PTPFPKTVVRFGSRTPIQASTTLHVAQPWFSSYLLRCSGDDMEIRLLGYFIFNTPDSLHIR
ncbi:hypothetical protein L9F63_016011, partial [Diploptera punctata]